MMLVRVQLFKLIERMVFFLEMVENIIYALFSVHIYLDNECFFKRKVLQ